MYTMNPHTTHPKSVCFTSYAAVGAVRVMSRWDCVAMHLRTHTLTLRTQPRTLHPQPPNFPSLAVFRPPAESGPLHLQGASGCALPCTTPTTPHPQAGHKPQMLPGARKKDPRPCCTVPALPLEESAVACNVAGLAETFAINLWSCVDAACPLHGLIREKDFGNQNATKRER